MFEYLNGDFNQNKNKMELNYDTERRLQQEKEQNGGYLGYLKETITRTRTKWRFILILRGDYNKNKNKMEVYFNTQRRL